MKNRFIFPAYVWALLVVVLMFTNTCISGALYWQALETGHKTMWSTFVLFTANGLTTLWLLVGKISDD